MVQASDALRRAAVKEVMAELFDQADHGNSTAMRLLGCCVNEGVNKKCNDTELAFRCFVSAAQQGDVHAQFNLGVCYAVGQGVRQDQVKATKWFLSAAGAGDTQAMRVMAIRLNEGRGCASDQQAATATFVRAAEAGDPTAEFNLGVRYATGHGISSQAVSGAKAFYMGGGEEQEASKKFNGHAVSDPEGSLFDGLSDFEEDAHDPSQTRIAVEWYTRAAAHGHCKAMYNLAHLMATGQGLPLSLDGATHLLRQAAHSNYSRAQYALALELARDAAQLRATSAYNSPDASHHTNVHGTMTHGDEAGRGKEGGGGAAGFEGKAGGRARGDGKGEKSSEAEALELDQESVEWLLAAAEGGYCKVCASVCMKMCICMYLNVYIYIHIRVYVYICIHICIHICIYIYRYIYIYVYVHVLYLCIHT